MKSAFWGYIRLIRPANLPTAAADILAGISIAGLSLDTHFLTVSGMRLFPNDWYLCFASVFLYAGGVVLNDVFDLEVDRKERPERPIPKGIVSQKNAAIFGVLLLVIGVLLAFWVNKLSGSLAIILMLAILAYDSFSKKYSFLGPLNMGVCRGLNLLLGMSVAAELVYPEFALIPVVYIFAVTLISRGEVHADNKKQLIWAGILYVAVIFAVVKITPNNPAALISAGPFILLFIILIFRPLIKAYRQNTAENIKKAVMAGVLAIVALDAILAAGFANWWYGIMTILLLPLSWVLSKIFAVT